MPSSTRISLWLAGAALLHSLFPSVSSQDGSISGGTSSPQAANYHCDPTQCKLPNCNCASVNPPGGLDPKEVPMFLVFTADDAIQSYTLNAVNSLIGKRQNPNGCGVKMSYYTSTNYTNYTLVTDWYVAGNEIADHTMTHVGDPPADEINGNLRALNALAGIPLASIQGFRAPFLNYSADLLQRLKDSSFTYDTSATATAKVTDNGTDNYWPYTLDNGLANNCLSIGGICSGKPAIPGFWELPMSAIFDLEGGIHLMDPWLDNVGTQTSPNNSAILDALKSTFTDHYNAQRQPFGLYTHPIHLATNYPGIPPPTDTVNMINAFLDWAQEQPDVWIVSNEQLLAWVRNPVPVSQLNSFDALKCSTPQISDKICNGMPANEAGLLSHCAFSDFPFYTCYGCPVQQPTPSNPDPAQVSDAGPLRFRVPANCSTAFWDPIGNKCLCTSSSCAFVDNSRPIGPNGANLTSGGTGGEFGGDSPASPSNSFVPFSGASLNLLPPHASSTLALATIGLVVGAFGFLARL